MLTTKDWANLTLGNAKASTRCFLMAVDCLVCPLLSCIHSPMLPFATPLHTSEGRGLLFGLSLEKIIVSRNVLPTIPFQMTWFTTNKTSNLLIFFLNFFLKWLILSKYHHKSEIQYYLYFGSFIYRCWSCLYMPNLPFAFWVIIFKRQFVNICLTSGSDIILFIAVVNSCKRSVKASFRPCITLVNESAFFPDSSRNRAKVLSLNVDYLCKFAWWASLRS